MMAPDGQHHMVKGFHFSKAGRWNVGALKMKTNKVSAKCEDRIPHDQVANLSSRIPFQPPDSLCLAVDIYS